MAVGNALTEGECQALVVPGGQPWCLLLFSALSGTMQADPQQRPRERHGPIRPMPPHAYLAHAGS